VASPVLPGVSSFTAHMGLVKYSHLPNEVSNYGPVAIVLPVRGRVVLPTANPVQKFPCPVASSFAERSADEICMFFLFGFFRNPNQGGRITSIY
jgi:hypothetical protein